MGNEIKNKFEAILCKHMDLVEKRIDEAMQGRNGDGSLESVCEGIRTVHHLIGILERLKDLPS